MEDPRCKLGLQGRLGLVRLSTRVNGQAGRGLPDRCAGDAHRWWHRWQAAMVDERASRAWLQTCPSRPRSGPWALSTEPETQAVLTGA